MSRAVAGHKAEMCAAPFGAVEDALDYRFDDEALLARALWPWRRGGGDARAEAMFFQRLEFLGDRVVGLVAAEEVYRRFTGEDEGALARRHTALVNGKALARAAERCGLEAALRVCGGVAAGGTLPKVDDSCEALAAAAWLDGGWPAARRVVLRFLAPLLREQHNAPPPVDAKTKLQEWALARGLPLPRYDLREQSGVAHRMQFTVAVAVAGQGEERGGGESKSLAQQAAAGALLRRLQGAGA